MQKTMKIGLLAVLPIFISVMLISLASSYICTTLSENQKTSASYMRTTTTYVYGQDGWQKSVERINDKSSADAKVNANDCPKYPYRTYDYRPSGMRDYYSSDYSGYAPSHYRYQRVFQNRDYPYDSYTKPYYYKARWNQQDNVYDWRY